MNWIRCRRWEIEYRIEQDCRRTKFKSKLSIYGFIDSPSVVWLRDFIDSHAFSKYIYLFFSANLYIYPRRILMNNHLFGSYLYIIRNWAIRVIGWFTSLGITGFRQYTKIVHRENSVDCIEKALGHWSAIWKIMYVHRFKAFWLNIVAFHLCAAIISLSLLFPVSITRPLTSSPPQLEMVQLICSKNCVISNIWNLKY